MIKSFNGAIVCRRPSIRIPMLQYEPIALFNTHSLKANQLYHSKQNVHDPGDIRELSGQRSTRGRRSLKKFSSQEKSGVANNTKKPIKFMELLTERADSKMYKNYVSLFRGPNGENYTPGSLNIQDSIIRIVDSYKGTPGHSVDGLEHSLYTLYENSELETLFSELIIEIANCFTNVHLTNKISDSRSLNWSEDYGKAPLLPLSAFGSITSENFTHDELHKIRTNEKIKVLLWRIMEDSQKSRKSKCRDLLDAGEIFNWVESLVVPSIRECSSILKNSTHVPVQVLYDILLRTPEDEFEWRVMYGIYNAWSYNMSQLDLLKLDHAVILQEKTTNLGRQLKYPKKALRIPFAFQNLFFQALRHNQEDLYPLINLFLKRFKMSTSNILQVTELMWNISIEIAMQGPNASRHLQEAYLLLVRFHNKNLAEHKTFDADVISLLAVSFFSYNIDKDRSRDTFQQAEMRFQKWMLESFNIDGFERVLSHNVNPIIGRIKHVSISDLRLKRGDLEAKLLCTSILLSNKDSDITYEKIFKILDMDDDEFMEHYPEVWRIALFKLDEFGILTSERSLKLWKLYLEKCSHIYDPYIFDIVVKNISTLEECYQFISLANQYSARLDTINFSKLMAKSYSKTLDVSDRTGVFDSPVSVSRYLNYYSDSGFRAINKSFILGEATTNSTGAYERYKSIGKQPSEEDILSLIVASHELKKKSSKEEYDSFDWGKLAPHERAINEFELFTQHSYMDDEKLIYPSETLWLEYSSLLKSLREEDKLIDLLFRWVDLKCMVTEKMLETLLQGFKSIDVQDFLLCCGIYRERQLKLQSLLPLSEMELKLIKSNRSPLPPVSKKFQPFVDALETNYDVIKNWHWPGVSNSQLEVDQK